MPFDPSAARSGTTFSDNPNYEGALLCYMNGIEVPIMSLNLTYGVWQIPQFQVAMVPDILLARLGAEDRVQVVIFYLDAWVDPSHPEFRLLCDGEIIGWNFDSQDAGRVVGFSCIAHAHIFQQLYFFYMTNVDDIVAAQSPEVRSTGLTTAGTALLYPYALFHQGLIVSDAQLTELTAPPPRNGAAPTAPATTPTAVDEAGQPNPTAPIQAPYELVYNIIKGVISKTVPDEKRAVPMMNFFARWIRKTRFHNRFVRLPLFEDPDRLAAHLGCFPIFNAARNDQALGAMQQQASQIANNGPIWSTIQQLLNYVFMELAMIPNPACVRVALGNVGGLAEDGRILGLLERNTALVSLHQDPATQAREAATGEAEVETALERAAAALDSTNDEFAQLDELVSQYHDHPFRVLLRAGIVMGQVEAEQRRAALLATRTTQAHELERLRRENPTEATRQPTAAETAAQASGVPTPPASPAPPANLPQGVDPLQPVRLAQYFVKPQFLFGVPPHCNVFFPSMLDGWSYDESYINQPTRMYINDSVMCRLLRASGANRELMLHALTVGFPAEANDIMHHKVGSSAAATGGAPGPGAAESGRNLLIWPEEYFKGPVTGRMELSSWMQTLLQFKNASTADPNAPPVPGLTGLVGGPAVSRTTGSIVIPPLTGVDGGGRTNNVPVVLSGTRRSDVLCYRIVYQEGNTLKEGVSVDGRPDYKAFLAPGGGLDPANYRLLTRTSLWDDIVTTAPPGDRRGRSEAHAQVVAQMPTRAAQFHRLLRTFFAEEVDIGHLTEAQKIAAVYGAVYICLREGGLGGAQFGWNFGNLRQFSSSPNRPWFANAREGSAAIGRYRKPYPAFDTAEQGARYFLRAAFGRGSFKNAIPALLGNFAALPPDLSLFLRTTMPSPGVFAGYAPIRPDWFYVALGYYKYYAEEFHTGDSPEAKLARMQIGVSAVQREGLYTYFTAMNNAYPSIPHDNAHGTVVDQTPLATAEDLAWVNSHPRTRATSRTVALTGTTPPLPETGTGHPPVTTTTTSTTGGTTTTTPTTTSVTPPLASADADAEGTAAGEPFAELFKLYAEYEFFRQRYYQRQSAIRLRFNPYVIPGFPCVLFDSMRTRQHGVGYVQTISHSWAATGSGQYSTQVSTVAMRTFSEFLNDVRNDAEQFGARVTAAPAETIDEIREIIQDESQAEVFYQLLLHGGARPNDVPAAFHWDQAVGYSRGGEVFPFSMVGESVAATVSRDRAARQAATPGESPEVPPTPQETAIEAAQADVDRLQEILHRPVSDDIDTPLPQLLARNAAARTDLVAAQATLTRLQQAPTTTGATTTAVGGTPASGTTSVRNGGLSSDGQRTVESDVDPNEALSPLPNIYRRAFDSYDVAMQLCSRPVCTLEQYIRFLHGGQTLNSLIAAVPPYVEGPLTDFSYASIKVEDVIGQGLNPDGSQRLIRGQTTREPATYYHRITRYRPGPGPGGSTTPPSPGERGYGEGPPFLPSPVMTGVPADYPETRANWDIVLEAYARKVRLLLRPSE